MINTNKVQLMSELNLYEKTKGRAAIKLNNITKHIRGREAVKNVICGIITYLLIAFVVVTANYETFSDFYYNSGIVIAGAVFLASMAVFVTAYFFFARHIVIAKHEKVKGNLWKYNFRKKKLRDVLFEERAGKDEVSGRQEKQE